MRIIFMNEGKMIKYFYNMPFVEIKICVIKTIEINNFLVWTFS